MKSEKIPKLHLISDFDFDIEHSRTPVRNMIGPRVVPRGDMGGARPSPFPDLSVLPSVLPLLELTGIVGQCGACLNTYFSA